MAELSTSAKVILVVVGLFLLVNLVGGVLLARAIAEDRRDEPAVPELSYCDEWRDEVRRVPGVRPTAIARRLAEGDDRAVVDAQFYAFFANTAPEAVQAATHRFDQSVTQVAEGRPAATLAADAAALERAIEAACR